ncbi:catalase family peroxidase [Aliidiomarina sedimenti]|nr:catalase family peroxidase [Aliidiomarina sedimenti]
MSMIPRHKVTSIAIIGFAVIALICAFLYAAGVFGKKQVTAQQFVDFQQGENPHLGFRRAHAKGVCVRGDFIATGELAAHTRSTLFEIGSTPFIGRFSIGGGNPSAPDLESGVRSLALSFDAGSDQQWRTAMNTPPVMAVGTPEDFYAQLQTLMPDPETGQRNPERIAEFFANHPETENFRRWSAQYQPSGSFSSEQYHSINAFYLINQQGEQQAVRWAAVPTVQIDENQYADTDQAANALALDVRDQLEDGTIVFDLVFTLASSDDDENDPTQPWPESRQQITAGQLVIRQLEQDAAICNNLNFDPLILPRGMQATNDPILRARSASYAESYRRRARETWLGKEQQQ